MGNLNILGAKKEPVRLLMVGKWLLIPSPLKLAWRTQSRQYRWVSDHHCRHVAFAFFVCACYIGLDAAGKTTMLYRLKPDVATTIPTIGKSSHCMNARMCIARFWALGGCPQHVQCKQVLWVCNCKLGFQIHAVLT